MLQEVHPDAVPLAEITIEESSLGLARYVVPVHAAPHRCAEGVGGVAFTTDDHEACGDVVRDGPGEQVTAGEDAAAEEDGDVHAATGGFGDRVAAEHADIAHGAEADEGVQVCGDIRFDHRPEGSCGYPAAGPHRRWPPAVCRRRSSDGGPSQAEPQFCCSGKSARPARATAYVTNVRAASASPSRGGRPGSHPRLRSSRTWARSGCHCRPSVRNAHSSAPCLLATSAVSRVKRMRQAVTTE